MGAKGRVIDAEFEVVGGPLRVGDEHPIRKGWFLTDQVDRQGNALWYKPPSAFSKWVRRVALIMFGLMMAVGILGMFLEEPGQVEANKAERDRAIQNTRHLWTN